MAPEAEIPVLTTTVEKMVQWARRSSIWPVTFGLACCAIEMMSMTIPATISRAPGQVSANASPRQSDLMIVAGRLSRKMAPALRRVYDQMPEPKWVISMGACASIEGVFDNYAALVQGVDQVVPVDVLRARLPSSPRIAHLRRSCSFNGRSHSRSSRDGLDRSSSSCCARWRCPPHVSRRHRQSTGRRRCSSNVTISCR